MVILFVVAVGAALGAYGYFAKKGGGPLSAALKRVLPGGDGSGTPEDFAPLIGRWRRTQGGYVIEVRNVEPSGRMDVRYYNPRSIHVAKAQASRVEGGLKAFIELRDKGYPGATYTLVHDARKNTLEGLYVQPTAGQTFAVVFVSVK